MKKALRIIWQFVKVEVKVVGKIQIWMNFPLYWKWHVSEYCKTRDHLFCPQLASQDLVWGYAMCRNRLFWDWAEWTSSTQGAETWTATGILLVVIHSVERCDGAPPPENSELGTAMQTTAVSYMPMKISALYAVCCGYESLHSSTLF